MPALPLPTQSNPQEFREDGDERLINCFSELIGGDSYRVRSWFGSVALSTDVDDINVRGAIEVDGVVYAVFEGGGIRKFTYDGSTVTRTDLDYISGSGPVFMARNRAVPPQVGILTQSGRFYVLQDDVIGLVNLDGLPDFNCLTELGGYFLLSVSDGRVFNTGLNDAYQINGLDFFRADVNADGIVGLFTSRQEVFVLGGKTTEVWGLDPSPPATGSPFTKLGAAVLQKGAMTALAIAEIDNSFMWIGHDLIVYRNQNYAPIRKSHYGVERSIASEPDKANIRATSFSLNGNAFWQLSGSTFTWIYNAATDKWHEGKSYLQQRLNAEIYLTAWDKILSFTKIDGTLSALDPGVVTENGSPREVVIRFRDIGREGPFIVNSIDLGFVTGRAPITGASNEVQPRVEIRKSDDGGATWGNARLLFMGPQGAYKTRVRSTRWGRTGIKWGSRFELRITDPHIANVTLCKINEAGV